MLYLGKIINNMATYEYVTFKGQELTLFADLFSPFDQTCEWEDCDKKIKEGKEYYVCEDMRCCTKAHAKKAGYKKKNR